ncbi:MAG TPA: flagellin [Nitrospirales bacterium]|nr:flagellin [Nitrospirales bacterium]
MSLTVNTNIPSITAQRNLGLNNSQLSKSLERLSSGLRVNRAADDAAGLAIANKLNFQARGLNQAVRNAGDATSLVQTAEGAFNVATNILGRLRELAVQAASDTNTSADRLTLKSESDQLVSELTRLANTTQFNGANLVDGSFASGNIQVGANANQTISFSLGDVRASQLGKFAQFSAALASGTILSTTTGIGNLTAGEFTINGQLVGATATTDDQVSVLELKGADVLSGTSSFSNTSQLGYRLAAGTATLYINGTAITSLANASGASIFSGASNAYAQNSEFISSLIAKINAAGITNVTARATSTNQGWALVATKGTDIRLALGDSVSETSQLSQIGLLSQAVGSGTAASEVSNYNGQSSAIAKVAAINSVQGKSGVTAVVTATTATGGAAVAAGSISANQFYINGVAVAATTGITAGDGTGALRAAVNAVTSQTGVTASVDGNGYLILSAADGRNISVYQESGTYAVTNLSGSGASLYRAAVKFTSNTAVTFAGTTTDVGSLTTNSAYNTDLSNSLSLIDISTQAGATTAITSIDAALSQISSSRAGVGAVQNRLDFTTQSLQTAAENQTAAESRIRDADFAFETSVYTRNQILVQAGTAILAQANSSSQIALQLLQK